MKRPCLQLLREWPPGFGGIERVAHELASNWQRPVYSLDAQPQRRNLPDSLPVAYPRQRLPRLQLGRLLLPRPSLQLRQLLFSSEPLHGHLPSPGVLFILVLARLLQPKRWVSVHWHAFLECSPGWSGILFGLYQWLALRLIPWLSVVVTTSPALAAELLRCGCDSARLKVLPCCLDAELERSALALPLRRHEAEAPLRVLFIGRLDSYKRLDLLLQALAAVEGEWCLQVVGDGPRRVAFEKFSQQLFHGDHRVQFLGCVDEQIKLCCLEWADVLVLPSDRSNEAFGIVQLEAMAAGIPSLAFQRQRSGMGWVGQLAGMTWSQQPKDLAFVLQRLLSDKDLLMQLDKQSRARYNALFSRAIWTHQFQDIGPEQSYGGS